MKFQALAKGNAGLGGKERQKPDKQNSGISRIGRTLAIQADAFYKIKAFLVV